jgi:hypothetical protein
MNLDDSAFRRFSSNFIVNVSNERILHKYRRKGNDTKSVLSIIKKMIGYTKDYLEEVKKSAEESTSTPETE